MTKVPHISVLLKEVLDVLSPKDGEVFVDGTFGAGGYSRAILEAANCTLYGIDRDPRAKVAGDRLAADYPGRFKLLNGCFGDMQSLLLAEGVSKVDGIALDIGVSSMQIDEAERGFSFMQDGPLDMRMSSDGRTAADVVNEEGEQELARILFHYGEERKSRAIAKAIVARREEKPFERTVELADLISSIVKVTGKGIHPATRSFQALRIYVNDELGELHSALEASVDLLKSGGRLAVVSFHSLEDRMVKKFLADRSEARGNPSRHMPDVEAREELLFNLVKRGAIKATKDEIDQNPRSRSARLRGAIRTQAGQELFL
ncbi:16S rRNA (cytosine(1402)-N(4))-methyltransferase RsmH [Sneathiella sp. P13V-1]|nr:16S rRNA (cytosine(1402)-N(4))-methyltransferase RsmH [Sneathiella sp. P13V-1]MBE7636677.1 16S rRNA (cytosine(1402)-N(4))-methyltransferase RsmH [Sneathiella sp. P13V-1]